jgi:hypothetical protein
VGWGVNVDIVAVGDSVVVAVGASIAASVAAFGGKLIGQLPTTSTTIKKLLSHRQVPIPKSVFLLRRNSPPIPITHPLLYFPARKK